MGKDSTRRDERRRGVGEKDTIAGVEIEVISGDEIDQAWERVLNSDVRYRFVIDTATL